ncbi:NAD(P)-binding protein [Zopfia rhizophila CBS 207.26]|uniref:NAD(P)-binding protein n=1 Tax=Zopfia rhizophila CBS 207.26 TaxID=1314779 RepID=A0A6A6D9Z7_9PEZI|nr:NAD(P)-binding protein [Zopfia rhizophila CBS 207.26]
MGSKLFITGATGYIGGSILDTIVTNHPEYDITVLLRSVPLNFSTRYPNVKIIKGDYDSFDILAEAASQANVVVHNGNSDHPPSLNALIAGLLRRSTPGFLIFLSGTGMLSDWQSETYLGKLNPKIWSDIKDMDEITSRPDSELHRITEKIVQEAAAKHGDKLKTAIMCPPDIYGRGKGLAKTGSVMVPVFVNEAKNVGRVFYTGQGTNTRGWVHIDDLMRLYLKVVEAAAGGGGNADWGKEGYYFASTQEISQLDLAKATGKILKKHNIIDNEEPVQISLEQVDAMLKGRSIPKISRYLFASNSRTRPERAEKLFGYKPSAPTLFEALEQDISDAVGKN